jgi:hypothetical protein
MFQLRCGVPTAVIVAKALAAPTLLLQLLHWPLASITLGCLPRIHPLASTVSQ